MRMTRNRIPSLDDVGPLALDLDMASAGCPNCKLLLVEADHDQGTGLFVAENGGGQRRAPTSSATAGAAPTTATRCAYETQYFTFTRASGIFVASGDNGNTGARPTTRRRRRTSPASAARSLTKSPRADRAAGPRARGASAGSCAARARQAELPDQSHACADSRRAPTSPRSATRTPASPSTTRATAAGSSSAAPARRRRSSPASTRCTAIGMAGPAYLVLAHGDVLRRDERQERHLRGAMCNAGAGWDGPTGNGTPNGAALGGGTTCTPQCAGKMCGNDGCGGTCGSCATGDSLLGRPASARDRQCTPHAPARPAAATAAAAVRHVRRRPRLRRHGTCTGGSSTCTHPIRSTGSSRTSDAIRARPDLRGGLVLLHRRRGTHLRRRGQQRVRRVVTAVAVVAARARTPSATWARRRRRAATRA